MSRIALVNCWSCGTICSTALAVPTPWALISSSRAYWSRQAAEQVKRPGGLTSYKRCVGHHRLVNRFGSVNLIPLYRKISRYSFLNNLGGPAHNQGIIQNRTTKEQKITAVRKAAMQKDGNSLAQPHCRSWLADSGVGDEEVPPGRCGPGSSDFDIAADPCIGARGPQLCWGERSPSHHFSPDTLTAGQTRFKAKRAPRRAHAR